MNPPIGFILLSHSKPHQLHRLIRRLNAMFNHPPIVCHHDFSQCAFSTDNLSPNVSFVRPHLPTAWADISIVEATVKAMEQMFALPDSPDWFVLMSGSDYPIKPAARILDEMRSGGYDAHISFERIRAGAFERRWQKICLKRYCTLCFPSLATSRSWGLKRPIISVKHPLLTRPFLPFSKDFECYAGSTWFSVNRRAAQYIIGFHGSKKKLANHYRTKHCPDESYFQTILANDPRFKLNNNNWRYTDWSAGGSHPKTLKSDDLPKVLSSPDHFARKFDMDMDADILDQLDLVNAS
jgi:hypothetical protein